VTTAYLLQLAGIPLCVGAGGVTDGAPAVVVVGPVGLVVVVAMVDPLGASTQ
jgi:hypothetical protein